MSAIGDFYVHYYARNYMRQGILNIPGHGRGIAPSPGDVILHYAKIKNKPSIEGVSIQQRQAQIRQLRQKYYNLLFNDKQGSISHKDMAAILEGLLQKKFKEYKPNIDNLLEAKITGEGIKKAGQRLKQITSNTRRTKDQYLKLVRDIKNQIKNIEANCKESTLLEALKNSSVASETIRGLYQRLEYIYNDLTMIDPNSKYSNRQQISGANINKINELIKAIQSIEIPVLAKRNANVQGLIGQWLAPWVDDTLVAMAKDAGTDIKKVIEEVVNRNMGTSGMWLQYDSQGSLLGEVDKESKEKLNQTVKDEQGQIDFKYEYHTSKADAWANISYNTGPLGNVKEQMSVKNYGSVKNITLVSGTTMESILNFAQDQRWAAHYLNNIVTHEDQQFIKPSLQNLAQKSFDKIALYVGLIGYSETQKPTLTIIFNPNGSGFDKVQIYDPMLLLNKLIYMSGTGLSYDVETNSIEGQNGETATYSLSETKQLQSNWGDTVNQRQNNILSQLSAQKIHVKLSISK